jgi:tRNA-2-methylthio-N6-dimethylallyladenosine synthase
MPKYHLITFGCQMNKSDSQRLRAVIEAAGFESVPAPEQADLILINACSVRETAMHRVWSLLYRFDKLKKNKQITTVVTGCILEEDKVKLEKRCDLVFNIKKINELTSFLSKQDSVLDQDYFSIRPKQKNSFQADVPIMTGCNNYCSYCVVPYVRDREVSRPAGEVIAEVKELVSKGCKEIHLLGQNVNSYAPEDKYPFSEENPYARYFPRLLWELNQIDDLKRIHFTSSHPKDMNDEVIDALTLPKQVNYLHLALQSGDDVILKNMNRKYTVNDYFKIIKKLRDAKPGIAIGTDIIVGYPGETGDQFQNTIKFFKKVRFDIAYTAMFSPRAGTAAAELVDDVEHEEKRRRWHELQIIMKKITLEKNKKYIGREAEVLIDTVTSEYREGNSLEMKRVQIKNSSAKLGDIVKVKVVDAMEWVLFAS